MAVLASAVSATIINAATIRVPADQPTIQTGIDPASYGDTVLVAPGTYTEEIDFRGKAIKVIGSVGADSTVLQSPASSDTVVLLDSGEPPGSQCSGFAVTGGSGPEVVVVGNGSEPVICNNVFHSYSGGHVVIHCYNSAPTIIFNLFYGNGGLSCVGVYSGEASIINNTFDSNARGLFNLGDSTAVAKNNIVTNSALWTPFCHAKATKTCLSFKSHVSGLG